jgi:hypothetical protein
MVLQAPPTQPMQRLAAQQHPEAKPGPASAAVKVMPAQATPSPAWQAGSGAAGGEAIVTEALLW